MFALEGGSARQLLVVTLLDATLCQVCSTVIARPAPSRSTFNMNTALVVSVSLYAGDAEHVQSGTCGAGAAPCSTALPPAGQETEAPAHLPGPSYPAAADDPADICSPSASQSVSDWSNAPAASWSSWLNKGFAVAILRADAESLKGASGG